MPFWRREAGGPKLRLGTRSVASSFHLWWQFSADAEQVPLVEVSAVCEVLVPPEVDSLYFWALQVGFHDGHQDRGAGHTGLQWHGREPGQTAVNWGGYRARVDGDGELAGSVSALTRLDQNGNTVAYPWDPRRPYRLRVAKGDRGWQSVVTDLVSGESTLVRELYAPGEHLVSPVVWSEVFAGCDEPSVTVRWSDLAARTAAGQVVRPRAVTVSYQDQTAAGCENTTVEVDGSGVLQTTNTSRLVPAGATLPLPPSTGNR